MGRKLTVGAIAIAVAFSVALFTPMSYQAPAFHQGGLIQLSAHQFNWTDPESGGTVLIVQEVFEGCSDGHVHEMTFQYAVLNLDYDPVPGVTNGFSGFQIIFPGPVPELHHQLSPDDPQVSATGAIPLPGSGPWVQNAFSGVVDGVEWDTPLPGVGILPGQLGVFSFCTFEREDVIVEAAGVGFGPAGWGHTWGFYADSQIFNVQTFIFHGFQSVPGERLFLLGIACDVNHIVCKKVKYLDEDGDGIIEVGEPVSFLIVIQVRNPSPGAWTSTVVEDRFGAEIDVEDPNLPSVSLTTKGKSAKEFLEWSIGNLPAGGVANLVLRAQTDLNPAGHQEYSECGEYEFNSGVVLKFLNPAGKKRSFESGGIAVTVPCDPADNSND